MLNSKSLLSLLLCFFYATTSLLPSVILCNNPEIENLVFLQLVNQTNIIKEYLHKVFYIFYRLYSDLHIKYLILKDRELNYNTEYRAFKRFMDECFQYNNELYEAFTVDNKKFSVKPSSEDLFALIHKCEQLKNRCNNEYSPKIKLLYTGTFAILMPISSALLSIALAQNELLYGYLNQLHMAYNILFSYINGFIRQNQ